MADEELLRRLDLIQATLQLAFKPRLDEAGKAIRSDVVAAAVLDETEDWIGSSELQKRVLAKTGKSARTVRDRLPELAAQGILSVRGGGRPEYRRTGVI